MFCGIRKPPDTSQWTTVTALLPPATCQQTQPPRSTTWQIWRCWCPDRRPSTNLKLQGNGFWKTMRLQGMHHFLLCTTTAGPSSASEVYGCCCSQCLHIPLWMSPRIQHYRIRLAIIQSYWNLFSCGSLRNSRESLRCFAGLRRALEKPLVYCVFYFFFCLNPILSFSLGKNVQASWQR